MNRPFDLQLRRTARRQFLKQAAACATALGIPSVVPGSVLGQNPPSRRINVALIGCGNQSTVDLPAFLQQDDVQVLAVCDVNRASHGYLTPQQFLGREPVRDTVNKYYAEKSGSGQFQGCEAYHDFRDVLARKDIDAVVVVVPDHWHGLITVMAAEAGKDIYCEKPMSLSIAQGQKMIAAVRKHKRILQTGSQFRSSPDNRFACELVRNGRIGKVQRVLTYIAPQNAVDPGPGWQPMAVPDGFDYDFWLGPAPKAPYHEGRCLYRFRFNLDYSGGQTTNFGAHSNDIAQWGLGMDETGPVELEDMGSEWPPQGSLYTTATKVAFRARYANGVELICETRDPKMGARFEGTEGWVQFGFGGLKTGPESLKTTVVGPSEIHLPRSNPAREKDVYGSYVADHVRNFIDAVKSRTDPIGPVEIGHRTASVCHLGNIAMLLKRKLQWDPQAERFVNDDEANRMLSRPMRAPWRI
ncbi:MAG: Gfo/Idh/MocA family oxidoreductase [Pirellulales bacterium]|nr:Gfo/Idh/MocA family oxidoreductase [Pirellulales bacterium]